jgi:peptidyl-tRNA hydrolase, PTH1 family
MPTLRCVVGLGNPGAKYADTRHNAGFQFVDALARMHGTGLREDRKFFGEVGRLVTDVGECLLLKPTTFMNHSGRAVSALSRFYRIEPQQILLAYDELDLPPGSVRLKLDGGHGGHNGLRDAIAALGDRGFARLRIGIGHPGQKDAVVGYVLARASREDQDSIDRAIGRALETWPLIQAGEMQRAMNALHTAA